jgi:crotonobetainyl-CoA:carnitine CoA-transferase CaiB-like acyl-CoA transferase
VTSDDAFERLRRLCGWPADPELASLAGRLARRSSLDERLCEWSRQREAEAVATELQAAGISAMMVQNGDDHRADPHLAARSAIVTVEHPDLGSERHAANPIRFGRSRLVAETAAPLLSADTRSVLADILGLGREEIERLIAEEVCV